MVLETRSTSLITSSSGELKFLSVSLLLSFVDVLGAVPSVFTSA